MSADVMVVDSVPSRGGDQWTGLPVLLDKETIEDYRERLISWVAEQIVRGEYGVSDPGNIFYSERSDPSEEYILATVMVEGFPDARLYDYSRILR